MSAIDEVKQKTDIVDVVSQYASLKKAGRNLTALCPFHSEKHPSFFIYPDQQTWHCFGACNTGGDVFSLVMKKEGIGFGEALRLLAQRAGITIPSRLKPEAEGGKKERLYQINQASAQYWQDLLLSSPVGQKARDYIASRGLSLPTITGFQLGYSLNSWEALKPYLIERGYTESELVEAGLLVETEEKGTHDRFRNRLMFPICDIRGRIIGFGARALDDSMPKYLNSPQTLIFDKSSTLYGINFASQAARQQDLVVFVEGYMDVLTAHQNGFTNVVATLGTAVTEKQISSLKRLVKNIVLALDADAAGEEAMLRCVNYENILNNEIKVMILPHGKDPDNVIKEDSKNWQHLLEEAQPVVDYTFNQVTANLNLTKAKDKSLTVEKLLPIVAELKDSVRQDHYLTQLAKLTGVSYQRLETVLGRMRAERRARIPSRGTVAQAVRPALSSPVEENCLALLLQHAELRAEVRDILPDYFADTQNREVFVAYRQVNEVQLIKEELDTALHDYLDSLFNKSLPDTKIEQRYAECVLRLRENFLRGLETKKAEALAVAAELGGSPAELAKLQEQGIETSTQLREVFAQKKRKKSGAEGN